MVCLMKLSKPLSTNFQASEGEKYPRKIEKLFTPKLPFLHKQPIDYPPHERATPVITLISAWKLEFEKYCTEFKSSDEEQKQRPLTKKQLREASLKRQMDDWEDAEAFAKNDFLKDPYKTVFVARLYYSLTELDLSKHFTKYGTIESIRIIRNTETGQSRGYGFIVFEREADAKNCIRELSPTGLSIDPPSSESKPRKILVDMERGRLVRNWRPRRLGGGLGGRHYTSASSIGSSDASAASSGRRLNLSMNPYHGSASQASARYNKRGDLDYYPGPNKRQNTMHDTYRSNPVSTPPAFSYSSSSYTPTHSYNPGISTDRTNDPQAQSVKDKYAKYQSVNQGSSSYKPTSGSGRSIRSIRQRE